MKYSGKLQDLSPGVVVQHKNEIYWVCDGLDDKVVVNKDGNWWFIKDLDWTDISIVYHPC